MPTPSPGQGVACSRCVGESPGHAPSIKALNQRLLNCRHGKKYHGHDCFHARGRVTMVREKEHCDMSNAIGN